jgi:hypothetical protein
MLGATNKQRPLSPRLKQSSQETHVLSHVQNVAIARDLPPAATANAQERFAQHAVAGLFFPASQPCEMLALGRYGVVRS